MDYITYKGKNYDVKDRILSLTGKGIKHITEIEGLDKLINLQKLNLYDNKITEIIGLEN